MLPNRLSQSYPPLLSLIQYVAYRLIRSIVQLESDAFVFLKLCLCCCKRTTSGNCCEVLSILYRKRFHANDVARAVDFITFHERWTSADELWQHQWMLYTVDDRFAYFVHMPQASYAYGVLNAPHLNICQFANADRLARLPNDQFLQQSECLRTVTGQLIAFSTMPGSGSTAFSALIQSSDPTTRNILVLSEMDALSAIAVHLADFSWTLQKIRSLLLASLRFITKDQLPDQMIILKMRSNCTRLVPHLKVVAPYVSHTFIGRRSMQKAILAQLNDFDPDDHRTFQMLVSLQRFIPWLCGYLTTLTRQEWPFQQWIRPKNVLQFLIALMAQPLIDFSKYQDCFSTAPLFYEDVISDPDDTLKSVLDAYGISQLGVPDSGEFDVYLNRYLAYGADERLELTASDYAILQQTCSLLDYPLIE